MRKNLQYTVNLKGDSRLQNNTPIKCNSDSVKQRCVWVHAHTKGQEDVQQL